jgi:hypothetical protein
MINTRHFGPAFGVEDYYILDSDTNEMLNKDNSSLRPYPRLGGDIHINQFDNRQL